MRYGTKHGDWTGFLNKEELAEFNYHIGQREWLRKHMKKHEDAIARLEVIAKGRRSAMREAAE